MISFVTKAMVFDYIDRNQKLPASLGLREIELAGVAALAGGIEMSRVGQVDDGDPQIDRLLKDDNEFYSVSLPDDKHPEGEVRHLDRRLSQSLGAIDARGEVTSLISIGCMDGMENRDLHNELERMLSMVTAGGIFATATVHYLEDVPTGYWAERLQLFRSFPSGRPCHLLAETGSSSSCRPSMALATLPDLDMYRLYRASKIMKNMRKIAQAVGLVVMYRRA